MSSVSRKNIIITGAGGLIGTHLLDLLKNKRQYTVIGTYQDTFPPVTGRNITYIKTDLAKKQGWKKIPLVCVDAIIHCAALIPSSFFGQEDKAAGRANSLIDGQAIEYAMKKKCRLIYFSSSGVYGMGGHAGCDENSGLHPSGGYLRNKVAFEKVIRGMNGEFKYHIFRISAPYGPFQKRDSVVSVFVRNALGNKPILYYGTGARTQDFIYAKDVACACICSLDNDSYGIYNIASGNPVSMKDLAVMVKRLSGSKSVVALAGIADPQESFRAFLDISKAERLLRWKPAYSLERGLKEFIRHLKRQE